MFPTAGASNCPLLTHLSPSPQVAPLLLFLLLIWWPFAPAALLVHCQAVRVAGRLEAAITVDLVYATVPAITNVWVRRLCAVLREYTSLPLFSFWLAFNLAVKRHHAVKQFQS